MIAFLRKFFGQCKHEWVFTKMIRVNQYSEEEENDEILSSSEYSLQKCKHCNKSKYRKL